MDKRQKVFMKVASIANLIEAGFFILIAITMFAVATNVSDATIISILKELKFINIGDIYNYSDSTGLAITLSSKNVSDLATAVRNWLFDTAGSLLFIALFNIVISIVILVHAKKGVYRKWAIIVGLIASIPASNWVCLAFYIVVLCLAKKQKEEVYQTIEK